MSTFRNSEGRLLPIGKPPRPDSLTSAAESARQSVRDLPPQRIVRDNGQVIVTRKPLTRAEVVAAYQHPAPEKQSVLVGFGDSGGLRSYHGFLFPSTVLSFTDQALEVADLRLTASLGTTPPRWHVPADSPVDPADYHGDVANSLVVWARSTVRGRELRVRAEWHDGRIHSVEVNGEKSSLTKALAQLRGEA